MSDGNEDRKEAAETRLEALLLEGINSGDPIEITPEYWEQKRARLCDLWQSKIGNA